jgi:hypothetical protein
MDASRIIDLHTTNLTIEEIMDRIRQGEWVAGDDTRPIISRSIEYQGGDTFRMRTTRFHTIDVKIQARTDHFSGYEFAVNPIYIWEAALHHLILR